MWNLSGRRDIYDKEHLLVSIDLLSPELLHQLSDTGESDARVEELKEAMNFAMGFLTEKELELLFFRFIHNNSYKTLKKTINLGSTKTAAKRIKKLKHCVKGYIEYYLAGSDYQSDLKGIHDSLGKDGVVVADMLFRRGSKNSIQKSNRLVISQNRLTRLIYDIQLVCLKELLLNPFGKVLENVGKISQKNK